MKKLLVGLWALLLLPLNANAIAYSESFNVGERVAVLIENDTSNREFYVLRPSAAGEQYVWLFYNGNVADSTGHTITSFDETVPGVHTATGILEQAADYAYKVLMQGTQTWERAEHVRLLNEEDMTILGLTKNSNNNYQIMNTTHFLAPIISQPGLDHLTNPASGYNYWTQIYTTDGAGEVLVYAVTYNESYSGDAASAIATLEPYNISGDVLSDPTYKNPEFIIRPVVKVDKKYIDCKVDENWKPITPTNPPTSETTLPFELFGIIALAGVTYVIVSKKQVFSKI